MADGLVSTLNASQSQNYGNKKDVGVMSLTHLSLRSGCRIASW